MNQPTLQQRTFLFLLIALSFCFAWILFPLYSAVFWAIVLAILFAPLHDRLLGIMRRQRNLAALVTLMLFLTVILIPFSLISVSLVQQGTIIYEQIHTGQIDFGVYFQQIISALPDWASRLLSHFGVTDFATLKNILSSAATEGSQFIAARALDIGQTTAGFMFSAAIMLYLLFFLLRDGDVMTAKIKQAIPLDLEHKEQLLSTFVTAIRATIKGNIIVAAVQGALGGMMFWILGIQGALLWGVVMAVLALLPGIGAALLWMPVAIYFLVIGATWQGVALIVFGILIVGLVDNILRPILVGKKTQMPDYVVLFSTLGGIVIFGLNGFVIGPVIAALFITVWDLFVTENEERVSMPE
ncbi:MAG TPA: AI-2E family transporter [Burkholderiaceae bacterium]|jgi:predicted PurR-regulated permease PerM